MTTIQDYYSTLPDLMHFLYIPEESTNEDKTYKLANAYGKGSFRKIDFNDHFMIIIANFVPVETLERISSISEAYLEISQFETETSSYSVGRKNPRKVERGICSYINNSKTVSACCEAGKLTSFTKVIISRQYIDIYLSNRFGDYFSDWSDWKDAFHQIEHHPNLLELNFIFKQIRECQAVGTSQRIYLEGKILELLSVIIQSKQKGEAENSPRRKSVKITRTDRRYLKKVISYMKKDLSRYPRLSELAQIANMGVTRFQRAFKQTYGTTVYDYLRELRMNQALILLKDHDYSIQDVALKVGYSNAGHFAGLFKKAYGLSPKEYRKIFY